MILLRAYLEIVPAYRAAFVNHIDTLQHESLKEAGCDSFAVLLDPDNDNAFTVLEEWTDHASFHAHETSAHVATFKQHVKDMIKMRLPTRVYEVSNVTTL